MYSINFLYVFLAFLLSYDKLLVESVSFEEDVTISYQQKVLIDKLRQRLLPHIVEDFMKDDIYLVKFLRSTDFDLHRAEKKLLENIKWRNETKMATIEKDDFSDVAKDYQVAQVGYDKQNRPVLVAFAGDWDIRNAVVTGRASRVLRYIDKRMEMLAREIRRLQKEGKNVTQAVLIVELSQFSVVTHACVQCLFRILEFLNSYESHFVGMCDKVLFVDAPPAVHFVIEFIRQNVSKETKNAIQIYGVNRAQWKKVLLEYIDKKYLPVDLGGTLDKY